MVQTTFLSWSLSITRSLRGFVFLFLFVSFPLCLSLLSLFCACACICVHLHVFMIFVCVYFHPSLDDHTMICSLDRSLFPCIVCPSASFYHFFFFFRGGQHLEPAPSNTTPVQHQALAHELHAIVAPSAVGQKRRRERSFRERRR